MTDILRLGLHRAQDTSDRPFSNLVSGTPLEVIERVPSYAKVRTQDGDEGWVKSAYLVEDKPAQLRLAELEAEIAALSEELTREKAQRAATQEETARLARQAAATSSTTDAIQDTITRLKSQNDEYEARLDHYRGSVPLTWAAAALTVALGLGFVCGLWFLDARIRRRHGGFRVY